MPKKDTVYVRGVWEREKGMNLDEDDITWIKAHAGEVKVTRHPMHCSKRM